MIQTIITDLSFNEIIDVLKNKYNKLSNEATFFAILSTEYDQNGNVKHDFLELIEYAIEIGYHFINTIIYPTVNKQYGSFYDNARYIVWLCKDINSMKINKDAIREKHIWKDIEWGKRTKNYNPKGKDPGNIWIPTLDDGEGHITEHILLDDEGVIERLLLLADCEHNYELIQENRLINKLSDNNIQYSIDNVSDYKGTVYFKSSENMSDIEDNSVAAAMTSPPYWDLKDYLAKGQIGQENYAAYLSRMKTVWHECYKKLKNNGSLWINIAMRVKSGKAINIPRDIVKICKEIGFYYKGIFIWHKSAGIPARDKNLVNRHEYVLVFSKQPSFLLNHYQQKIFRDYKNDFINGGVFWNINKKIGNVGKQYIHPAIYPVELPARIIQMASHKGDIVLDPFLGSGTSLIAAIKKQRNFIGYEFNKGFKELIEYRCNNELLENTTINYF